MPFITGYLSNIYIVIVDLCVDIVSMPFITGYLSNWRNTMKELKVSECFNALYHGLPFKQKRKDDTTCYQESFNALYHGLPFKHKEKKIKRNILRFQCPLSRATFQTEVKSDYDKSFIVSMPFITGYLSNPTSGFALIYWG